MKTLLLTDIPPTKDYTAGLVLDQLCQYLPQGTLACYALIHPFLNATLSPDLADIPFKTHRAPFRRGRIKRLSSRIKPLVSFLSELAIERIQMKSIVHEAIAFGRELGMERVWCLLESPAVIRIALPIAQGLGVPLFTQVFDPPDWWLEYHHFDRFSKAKIIRVFETTLRQSQACAAASWNMAKVYRNNYGIRTVPVVPSLSHELVQPVGTEPHDANEFVIGMAGQLYASDEWNALLTALQEADWEIAGRKIRIRVMGPALTLRSQQALNIEYLGWRSQREVIKFLAETDVMYMPYRFGKAFEKEARLCFPAKLTTYLTTGRPILIHAPEYASPAQFLAEYQAGLGCYSLDPAAMIEALEKLITQPALYRELALNGRQAFLNHLTLEKQRAAFESFLQGAN